MQPDKLRQWHMWQRMSWVQLPTQSGPHAQRPMNVSVTRQVAWNVNGNVHNFRAKSGISCLTTRSCATKSAGSYSIADRLACTTTTTLVSNVWYCHLEYKVKKQNQKYFAKSAQHSVHWTLGIPPHFRAFFLLRVFFCSQAESTPAPAPVTQTVRETFQRRWYIAAASCSPSWLVF